MVVTYEELYKQNNYTNKLIGKQIYLKDIIDINYLFYMEVQSETRIGNKYGNEYDYFYNNKFTFIKNVKYTENKEVFFFEDEKNGVYFYIVILRDYIHFNRVCFLRFTVSK